MRHCNLRLLFCSVSFDKNLTKLNDNVMSNNITYCYRHQGIKNGGGNHSIGNHACVKDGGYQLCCSSLLHIRANLLTYDTNVYNAEMLI